MRQVAPPVGSKGVAMGVQVRKHAPKASALTTARLALIWTSRWIRIEAFPVLAYGMLQRAQDLAKVPKIMPQASLQSLGAGEGRGDEIQEVGFWFEFWVQLFFPKPKKIPRAKKI